MSTKQKSAIEAVIRYLKGIINELQKLHGDMDFEEKTTLTKQGYGGAKFDSSPRERKS